MDTRVDEYIALTGAFLACLLEYTTFHFLTGYLKPFADYLVSFFPHEFPNGWMDPTAIIEFTSNVILYLSVFTVYFVIIYITSAVIHRASD